MEKKNEIKVVENNNQRVLLTSQLAEKYGTTEKVISNNFIRNAERYTEGKHYYCLTGEELKEFKNQSSILGMVDKRTSTLYLWTEKGALLHAKSLGTDKAWEVYEFLVDNYFKKSETAPKLTGNQLIATALIEANKMIEEAKEQNKQLEMKIETDKPKVIFADAVSVSNTSILVGDLAKIIKQNGINIGANRLFAWLRENGYLISRKGSDYNSPTQKSMELKLFEVKETVVTHSDGHTSINKTPKVTGKGQQYFVNKFLNA